VVDDAYRIVRRLGRGGMGEVYQAERVASGEHVALKCVLRELAQDDGALRRFQAEARAASGLGHPNIVDVFATGTLADGRPYLCMELLRGHSLQHELDTHGRLSEARAVELAIAVCDALQCAHAGGIVHRDLKPANVFIVPRTQAPDLVKLLDFGVAKMLAQPGARLTTTGIVLGTPHFMAPEQASGEGEIDQRVDVYALGVLLYYCVTGRLPFEGKRFVELVVQICSRVPEPPEQLCPELSLDLSDIIQTAMQKLPGRRFSSAHALKTALEQVGDGCHKSL
jgi:serine/threonine-protein kinase